MFTSNKNSKEYGKAVMESFPIGSKITIEHPATFEEVEATVTGWETESYQSGGSLVSSDDQSIINYVMLDGSIDSIKASHLFGSDPLKN